MCNYSIALIVVSRLGFTTKKGPGKYKHTLLPVDFKNTFWLAVLFMERIVEHLCKALETRSGLISG